ncbi:hypothetical protein [Streptomyces sp. NPDC050848]|uniref:hypothetical protein n=1 Tax=Streptomyces sp. NPDC050848 TaxID=3155791 RepID=UPI0033CAAA7D
MRDVPLAPNGRLTAVPLGAPPDSRQVWLPAELTCLTGLPDGLRYAHWDGRSPFPSDPAAVEFYVPPLVQDIGVISRPLDRMTRLKAVQALSSGPTVWGRGWAGPGHHLGEQTEGDHDCGRHPGHGAGVGAGNRRPGRQQRALRQDE